MSLSTTSPTKNHPNKKGKEKVREKAEHSVFKFRVTPFTTLPVFWPSKGNVLILEAVWLKVIFNMLPSLTEHALYVTFIYQNKCNASVALRVLSICKKCSKVTVLVYNGLKSVIESFENIAFLKFHVECARKPVPQGTIGKGVSIFPT